MLPLQAFKDNIDKKSLFAEDDKILLAVSGGKDSMLMVQLFKLCNYKFSICHCNFNLRGDESHRDQLFVQTMSKNLDVPYYAIQFDTKLYAMENHISTQMAARDLRYQWFEQIRLKGNYNYIAVAHHQNDVIETVMLNLVRGTGISGLHGIAAKKNNLIRPMLFLTRPEIDAIVEEHNINFVEDSSNQASNYARNKIRLNVIPALKELNPNLERTFAQNIFRFSETEEVLQLFVEEKSKELVTELNGNIYISIEAIRKLKPQKLILFELLRPFHFSDFVVDEIISSLEKQSGTSFHSPTHLITIDRKEVIVSPIPESLTHEIILIHPDDQKVTIAKNTISVFQTDSILVESNSQKAFVDLSKLIFPLIVRFRQDGDRFKPLGMKNFKKLSDFLIDNKVPLPQKDKIPLLINGNGEIIWVAGLRQDNRYKVQTTTKKVVIFELS